MTDKINEGTVNKGGVNEKPSCPRPARPKGQRPEFVIQGIDPAIPGRDYTLINDYCRHGNRCCRCIAAARETFEKGYDARKLGVLFEVIRSAKDDIRLGTDTIFGLRKIIKAFDDLRMDE
jgi:hypothetical protein